MDTLPPELLKMLVGESHNALECTEIALIFLLIQMKFREILASSEDNELSPH
jgi:hypothetical protein